MAVKKTVAGTYRVDFRDQHGKRIRKTFERLEDARSYNKQSLGDVSKGDFVAPSDVTVKDMADAWHKRKKDAGTYRYSTLHGWQIHIDKHIVPALGEIRIQTCTVEQIETAAAGWAKIASPKTANKILNIKGLLRGNGIDLSLALLRNRSVVPGSGRRISTGAYQP